MSYQFDHRQLADEMEIFFFDDAIGAGLPVWLPNGVAIRDQLESFIKNLERLGGYQRVVSPHLGREDLYEKSGHLNCFSENMYPPIRAQRENQKEGQKENDKSEKIESQNYYLKPMNCPHHHKVFSALPRSYRQLPLRIAEFGQVYRFEPSGSMRGLSRVRGLCQNDAHIYVDPMDCLREVINVLSLHQFCYEKLGLSGFRYRLSLRDPSRPNEFQGESSEWDKAESILREAMDKKGLLYFEAIGEAAFYGPKIDVQMKMGSGQEESIASIQLDFQSAEKFNLAYSASSGEKVHPWIIHRAPLGSHERLVALLLEYFDGKLPGWLSPVQIMLIPLSEQERSYCNKFRDDLLVAGVRVKVDESQGSLAKRILFAHRCRPFSKLVIGPREIKGGNYKLEMRDGIVEGEFEEIVKELNDRCDFPK